MGSGVFRQLGAVIGLLVVCLFGALPFAPSYLVAAPAHEEGGKLEYIAANLAETPFLFDPLNLELVDELQLVEDGQLKTQVQTPVGPLATSDLYVSGHHAYLGSFADAVHIVDISQPHQLELVAQIPTSGPAVDVKVDGEVAVVGVQKSGSQFGLLVVDVSNPLDPRVVGELSDPSWRGVHNLFLAGDRAYLAPIGNGEQVRGVIVVDLSDPTRPAISGNWVNERPIFSNRIHDIFVDDGVAYLSDFFSGLVLLDLTDRDNPVTLASLYIQDGIHSAWAHNGFVYCNQEFGGARRPLHIVDVTDLSAPVLTRSFRADVPLDSGVIGPHNPYVRDSWLYWAYYDSGLRVFDISIPDRPVEVASHPSTLAWGAHAHTDGHIYVADSRLGLRAFRFNRPAFAVRDISVVEPVFTGGLAPIEISTQPLPHRTDQVLVRVAVSVEDLSSSPVVCELRDDGLEEDSNASDGIFSGSFSLPENAEAGTYRLRAWTEDDGGAIYPLDGTLEVLEDQQTAIAEEDEAGLPDQFELTQNFPNPFNSDTVIHFALNEPGAVDLGIYNTAAQRLTTLVDGVHPAGRHAARWNGRDDDGRPLASGVYLYRLNAGGRQILRKLLLVR